MKTKQNGRNNNFPHCLACKNTKLHICDIFGAHTDIQSVLGVENRDVPVASVDASPADCNSDSALSGKHQDIPSLARGDESKAARALLVPECQRRCFQSPEPLQEWHNSSRCCLKSSWASHVAAWFTPQPLRYWVSLVNNFNYFTKQVVEVDQYKIWHLGLQCWAFIMGKEIC